MLQTDLKNVTKTDENSQGARLSRGFYCKLKIINTQKMVKEK